MSDSVFDSFMAAVRDIAEGNAASIAKGEDPLVELELTALLAAAHAFAVYGSVRAMREGHARQQPGVN